jgi:hypothetical protein
MNRRTVYLFLSVLGTALPYWQFLPWVLQHGWSPGLFVAQLFANRISAFFGLDVVVAAVVSIYFFCNEGKRLHVRFWPAIAATLLVGVSLGLPLFLFLREGAPGQASTRAAV